MHEISITPFHLIFAFDIHDMAKLLQIFENYASNCNANSDAAVWVNCVSDSYSEHTLTRLLSSSRAEIRQAASWALSHLGNESHLMRLGDLLRDSSRIVRTYADEARRAIVNRTQSPWHRETANRVEQLLADGNFASAGELATHLVDEAFGRAEVYMLRAWVRFSDGEIESAADDCKRTLSLDPFCYQACVALGQCLWHLGRNMAARECYCEAARIYPDWEPARAALAMMTE